MKLEEELGAENLDNSRKQALCGKLEQLLTKLDSTHAEVVKIVNSDTARDWSTVLSKK